jgi:hypothetical protein
MPLRVVDILPFTVYKTDKVEFNVNEMQRLVTHCIAQADAAGSTPFLF